MTTEDKDKVVQPLAAGESDHGVAVPLVGGVANADAVMLLGETVIRPAGPHTPAVHALLNHLWTVGFHYVPRPIAIVGGNEKLSYIPGDVPIFPYQKWCSSERTLREVAMFLRKYHEAVISFAPPASCMWSDQPGDPHGGPLLCHNDMLPENMVFEKSEKDEKGQYADPIGLLDFDFASPGRAVWDIARAVRIWVPVDDPASAATYGWGGLNPFQRLKIFCDSYGLPVEERGSLVEAIEVSGVMAENYVRKQVLAGKPGFVNMWKTFSVGDLYERRRGWLQENRTNLLLAIT